MQPFPPSVIWFRQDLRLLDNPALRAAAQQPLIAIYIWDEEDLWAPGEAARWWLYKSLGALQKSLQEYGIPLIFRKGNPLKILKELFQETNFSSICWNRCYEPHAIKRDQEIKSFFKSTGVHCRSFNGSLLVEPWELQTKAKEPYKIFTPFWNALQKFIIKAPLPIPAFQRCKINLPSESLEEWGWEPKKWAKGLENCWNPGEKGAWKNLYTFLKRGGTAYSEKRDFPAEDITSRLSPYLCWGELSPSQVWHEMITVHGETALPFLRQLGWRDFSRHLLYHFPHLPSKSLRPSFEMFPWESNVSALKAWQQGKTGYPIVDAGMRELWHTGWMHNRVRMIVASFLVKDLLLHWKVGEKWFWDTLVDADLANNATNWQWVAGCGTDAAPYFRIFNPSLQSQKFDPEGKYIKKWIPELQNLKAPYIHSPWKTPPDILENAGIQLGKAYPFPIVDHSFAYKRAIEAFSRLP